jgi:nicotinamide mononucleotide transporter
LYFYKGLTVSSLQFIVFTIIAILGYKEWKIFLQKKI